MSGGFNPINMVSQVALGIATGGSSLLASLAMQVVSQVAKQVIQQVGQQIGLPPAAVDAALGAFDAASGNVGGLAQNVAGAVANFAQNANLSPLEHGQLQQHADNAVQNASSQLLQDIQNGGSDVSEGNGKDSFLIAFAKAMGRTLDNKMNQMMTVSGKIDDATQAANATAGTDAPQQAVTGQLTAELQGLGQEVGIVSAALTNSLKSIGDAMSGVARKG